MKIILLINCILLIIFNLTSCKKEDKNSIAIVNGQKITKEEYEKNVNFYTKFFSEKFGSSYLTQIADNKKRNIDNIKTDVLNSLIHEKIMLDDLKKHKIDINKDQINKLKEEQIEKLNGKDSLKANLDAFDENLDDYDDILLQNAIGIQHKNNFLSTFKIKDKTVVKYYKKNKKLQKQYKYIALKFNNKDYANSLKSQINNNQKFREYANKEIKNFEVIKSDFVYIDDALLSNSKVTKKNQLSNVFKFKNDYYILMIISENTDQNDLLVKARDLIAEKEYDEYYKNMIKKSKVEILK
ncbi:MAG: SurA N-terminal domain-containing protein [Tissierellia bacterium]|nr:SurA N-terminal domain-containing protein [Tissierellia bacterium]